MKKILLIEDNAKIRRYLELELTESGYNTISSSNGTSGLKEMRNNDFDLLLLDLGLPDITGENICKEVRTFSNIPIIILTAKDEVLTKVSLLDLGADDYITKPFVVEELLARIRVCLRNKQSDVKGNNNHNNHLVVYKDISIDLELKSVFIKNIPIQLTKTEFLLLHYLTLNREIILTREQIISNVWGYDYIGDEKIVDAYIKILRKKINVDYIKTVRGFGYILKGE